MDNMKNTLSTMNENKKWGVIDYIKAIGPAFIVAAVIIGPGSVTTASVVGSKYGYQAIWIICISVILAFFYQEPAIRITLNRKVSLVQAVREEMSPVISIFLYTTVFLGALAFQAGNFLGASLAMNYFVPALSLTQWTITMALGGLVMALLSAYKILENITKVLIGMMVLAFAITAVSTGPSIGQILSEGFAFKVPGGNYILLMALLSTTVVPDIPLQLSALLKQKYLGDTQEPSHELTSHRIKLAKIDLKASMIMTAVIVIAIIVCSGTILHPQGIEVKSAADMAKQLTPLLGRYAGILFSLGLWAAGFSSGLFRVTLSALLFNQAFGLEEDLKANRSRIIMVISSIVPVIIVAMFGKMPVQLIVAVQALNGVSLPIVTGILWKLTNDKNFLGEYVNTKTQNVFFGILMTMVTFFGIKVFLGLFGVI